MKRVSAVNLLTLYINFNIKNAMKSLKKKLGSTGHKILKFLYFLGCGVAIFVTTFGLMIAFSNHRALATASPWPVGNNGLPDFTRVTPSNFTRFNADQCFTAPPSAAHLISANGFCVKAGDSFAELPLSILDTISGVGGEKINDLLTRGGINPANISLEQLPFIPKISSKELFESLGISQAPVSNILKEQLRLDGLSVNLGGRSGIFGGRSGIVTNQAVFNNFPQVANNPLDGNLPLNGFSELGNSQLGSVTGALQERISAYPGLADRAFTSFPNPPTLPAVPTFIKMDKILKKENISKKVSTGSLQNRSIPCSNQCDGIEVQGVTPNSLAAGTTVVSGDSQETNSGFGFLGGLNIGREPTGDFPLGEMFKESIHNVSAAGTANRAFNFRICDRGGFLRPDLGCTKYFIGPIVFGQYSEKGRELALMGNPQFYTSSVVPSSISNIANTATNVNQVVSTAANTVNTAITRVTNTAGNVGGVDIAQLQQAITNSGIPNVSTEQVRQYVNNSHLDFPDLSPSELLKQAVVDIYGGTSSIPTATNPLSGETADQFAQRVAQTYVQG